MVCADDKYNNNNNIYDDDDDVNFSFKFVYILNL